MDLLTKAKFTRMKSVKCKEKFSVPKSHLSLWTDLCKGENWVQSLQGSTHTGFIFVNISSAFDGITLNLYHHQ